MTMWTLNFDEITCLKNKVRATFGTRYHQIEIAARSAEAPWSTAAAVSTGTAVRASARSRTRLGRKKSLALHLLARKLAGPADGFRFFPRLLFGWLFVMAAEFHLAEDALTLHFLFERLQGLVDVVVANENLHACFLGCCSDGLRQKPRKRGL
jgi:hypothetical protein